MDPAPSPTKTASTMSLAPAWTSVLASPGPSNVEPAPSAPAKLTKYLISTVFAAPVIVTRTGSAEPKISGASTPITVEVVAAPSSSPSPQSWPTWTLQVAENIMPTINPITIPCELGQPNGVDCSKMVPQSPPVNVPAPIQTSYSIAEPVTPQPNWVQTTAAASASVVAPTGWVHGPPPFDKGELSSASVSVAHEDKPSVSSSAAPTSVSSHISPATVVLISHQPSETGTVPINFVPSETGVVPINSLLSETGIVPIRLLPSGTGSITSSAILVQTSTLAIASSPGSSAGSLGDKERPGMGNYSTQNTISAATASVSAPWLTLLVSMLAGTLVMV
ncbi:hypothetical protein P171DRAFT_8065 [Karstenula rhodostoma CBS 690.94]|uniref:Uncharacterized protein n=1 Tax=Karstenula rhodostoma CBS 690.94 TaxID=1392251 RepID=A0A9P4PW51_9PLEO|nr:hypothetical protein P171DRAFT_8065 [Karstenula rhodostoma CBS 690.94]